MTGVSSPITTDYLNNSSDYIGWGVAPYNTLSPNLDWYLSNGSSMTIYPTSVSGALGNMVLGASQVITRSVPRIDPVITMIDVNPIIFIRDECSIPSPGAIVLLGIAGLINRTNRNRNKK